MPERPIQEQFGEKVIEAFADFARHDLEDPDELAAGSFGHVDDRQLRRELSQVFYGARWIYKLGLALLTKDEERAAHVRAQIVDYASVCEALLSYSIHHAIEHGHVLGTAHQWRDPVAHRNQIVWVPGQTARILSRQSMWWLIEIGRECRIVSPGLKSELDWLRKQRNTVHLRARAALGPTAFLNQSKRAFKTTTDTMRETRAWRGEHP